MGNGAPIRDIGVRSEAHGWSIGVLGAEAAGIGACGWRARNYAEKITDFLASQARHEMGAPMELFAGAKRGRESSDCFTKVRDVS